MREEKKPQSVKSESKPANNNVKTVQIKDIFKAFAKSEMKEGRVRKVELSRQVCSN